MNKLSRYIAIFLLACLLPILTPREFIHDLFGHDDTRDLCHAGLTLEKAHRHCSIFQVTFSTFITNLKTILAEKDFQTPAYSCSLSTCIPAVSVNLSSLRAPPSGRI